MVTAVARKGELEYAFYRGTTYLGAENRAVPAALAPVKRRPGPPNQPPSQDLDSNLKSQNSANNLKQLNRLQQRYNQPAEMQKGAPGRRLPLDHLEAPPPPGYKGSWPISRATTPRRTRSTPPCCEQYWLYSLLLVLIRPRYRAQTSRRPLCKAGATADRVFELRTYYTNEGKLDDLHKRFRDHTCALLKKHGAELIGFWTPLDDKDGKGGKLVYLVAFPEPRRRQEDMGRFPERPRVAEGLQGEPQERSAGQESRIRLPRADRLQRDEVARGRSRSDVANVPAQAASSAFYCFFARPRAPRRPPPAATRPKSIARSNLSPTSNQSTSTSTSSRWSTG